MGHAEGRGEKPQVEGGQALLGAAGNITSGTAERRRSRSGVEKPVCRSEIDGLFGGREVVLAPAPKTGRAQVLTAP